MNQFSGYAALPLRLAVGGVFLRHGIMKWSMGVAGVAGFLHGVGIPFSRIFAVILIAIETVGAVCVILGVFTRVWAGVMAVEMVIAILRVRLPQGGGFELEALLCAGAVSLALLGDGPIALGVKLKRGY